MRSGSNIPLVSIFSVSLSDYQKHPSQKDEPSGMVHQIESCPIQSKGTMCFPRTRELITSKLKLFYK